MARSIAWHRVGRTSWLRAHEAVTVKSTGRRGRVMDGVDGAVDTSVAAATATATNEQHQDVNRPSHASVPNKKRPKIEVAAGDGTAPCKMDRCEHPAPNCCVQYDDDASIEIVNLRLLVPIYSERRQRRPASEKDLPESSPQVDTALPILVTHDTATFRTLARTQLVPPQQQHHDRNSTDTTACAAGEVVLEIGTSTGEMSQLLWKQKDVACWMGWDTAADMVQQVQRKLKQHSKANSQKGNNQKRSCYKMDPLMEPDQAAHLVRQEFDLSSAQLTVFVDIGGDRQLHAVVLLLQWIIKSFSSERNNDNSMLGQIIVKSETLYQALRDYQSASSGDTADSSSYFLDDGGDWLKRHWRTAVRESFPRHPLQAPRRILPLVQKSNNHPGESRAICRYHNYHPEGCAKHADGRCPYDHDHCHLCLQVGHVARNCDLVRNDDKDDTT